MYKIRAVSISRSFVASLKSVACTILQSSYNQCSKLTTPMEAELLITKSSQLPFLEPKELQKQASRRTRELNQGRKYLKNCKLYRAA